MGTVTVGDSIMNNSDRPFAPLSTQDKDMDGQTQFHAYKQMFFTLGCLTVLATSAPACDTDGLEQQQQDVVERAALDTEPVDALELADMPVEGQAKGPQVLEKVENVLNPNDVWIESVQAFGVGCSTPNSILTDIAPDKKSFIVIFKDMVLENPGGSAVKTTNCQASVQIHVPNGWQVSVATINTRGYAFLEQGIKAKNSNKHFFAGDPFAYVAHTQMVGPYDDFYDFTEQIPSVVWSKCGASALFGINTTLLLNAKGNKNGSAFFNATSQKVMHMQWQQC
jgi:hypothetical protein